MSAAPEGPVHIDSIRLYIKQIHRFFQHDADMFKRHGFSPFLDLNAGFCLRSALHIRLPPSGSRISSLLLFRQAFSRSLQTKICVYYNRFSPMVTMIFLNSCSFAIFRQADYAGTPGCMPAGSFSGGNRTGKWHAKSRSVRTLRYGQTSF